MKFCFNYLAFLFLVIFIMSCGSDEKKEGEPEGSKVGYVEVAGIKWAKGNLLYDKGEWKIADKQWRFYTSGNDQIGLFNYGMVTTTRDSWYKGDIAICGNSEYDIARCRLGGLWRLPSSNEMDLLLGRASRSYGYCIGDDGERINGWYFYNNDGNQKIDWLAGEITDEKLENGLFLPFSKIRLGSSGVAEADQGVYWTGSPYGDNPVYAYYLQMVHSGMSVGVESDRYHRWDGLAIRPIYGN